MNSILNNSAALSALQALQMTQQSLNTVQNQVSTGLKVASAADNSSYWSIATQLNTDSGVVQASNDALSQGQSVLATATLAINSVITTINSIATALTRATSPARDRQHQHLARLAWQTAHRRGERASFNGMNVLNGSLTALNFVSGFNATATGGSINTIGFTAQALYGLASGTPTSTTSQSTLSDPTTMAELQTQFAADTADTTAVTAGTVTATYGADAIYEDTTNQAFTVQSLALDGTATTTTYTALDANGNSIAQGGAPTFATAASYAVTTTVTTPASQNLVQNGTESDQHQRRRRHRGSDRAERRRPGARGGHQLRRPDRRDPGPHDHGEHVQHRVDDELLERGRGHGRCGHEHRLDPIAGPADPGAARHPVAVDRQPERGAHPEAVPVASTLGERRRDPAARRHDIGASRLDSPRAARPPRRAPRKRRAGEPSSKLKHGSRRRRKRAKNGAVDAPLPREQAFAYFSMQ